VFAVAGRVHPARQKIHHDTTECDPPSHRCPPEPLVILATIVAFFFHDLMWGPLSLWSAG
jgi:hypothetical protein